MGKFINSTLVMIGTFMGGLVLYTMFRYNMLNFRFINYGIAIGFLVFLALLVYLIATKKSSKLVFILALLFTGGSIFSYYYIDKAISLVEKFNENSTSSQSNTIKMRVVVTKDSPINTLTDLKSKEVLAPIKNDSENIKKFAGALQDKEKVIVNLKDEDSYVKSYDKLIKGETEVIIINSLHEGAIKMNDPKYTEKIKVIYETEVPRTTANVTKHQSSNQSNNTLNIYISGIDTYGNIAENSRSDVNIIMTINKKTNKILLTTTPRDTYIPIAGGGADQYDKLTHAGIYGVDASIQTLENLYNIDIDYYARINFSSFLKLIDAIGGVEVYNEQEFKGLRDKKVYQVGNITLNSQEALEFVRERYGLANGDNDRGKNQQKVMTAIIKKLTTPGVLINYEKIISELSNSIQTDMPIEEIMGVANEQLDKQAEFTIESQALEGYGVLGLPSYAMPASSLYMMQVSEQSLETVKRNIFDVLGIEYSEETKDFSQQEIGLEFS